MSDIGEIVIAVALSSPKMSSVLLSFFGILSKIVFAKPQDDYVSNFEGQILAGKKDPVARDKGQNPFLIFRQLLGNRNPI